MQIPYLNETRALLVIARTRKAQGSLEYIMMLSAVSIVVVIALAMIAQLKGAALHGLSGGSGQSVASELSNELANISSSST